MKNKAMALNQLGLLILMAVAIVAAIALFIHLLRPTSDSMGRLVDESGESTGGIIDRIRESMGKSCDGEPMKCDYQTNKWKECKNGKWEITEKPCGADI